MDIVNLGQARHFLRDHPIRVNLFDRPRLVGELICLEPGQEELRRSYAASDELYVVIEGKGQLRSGVQTEALQALDTALVPPGVDHALINPGPIA